MRVGRPSNAYLRSLTTLAPPVAPVLARAGGGGLLPRDAAVLVLCVILTVWVGAILIALALCRTATAGDRGVVDTEPAAHEPAAPSAHEPAAPSAHEPAAPSASASPRATTRAPAHS